MLEAETALETAEDEAELTDEVEGGKEEITDEEDEDVRDASELCCSICDGWP